MSDSGYRISFGTDGWRAVVAEGYTYDNVRRCAHALACVLKEDGRVADGVVVGFDTRFCSFRFAEAAATELTASGLDVFIFDRPAPTPACSFSVASMNLGAGVMITASHNPPEWNGFKVRMPDGGAAPPGFIARIENHLAEPSVAQTISERTGSITRFNPLPEYIEKIGALPDLSAIRRAPLRVVVDSMHGAGGGLIKRLAGGHILDVEEIRGEPNPAFPHMKQPEPIESNLAPLREAVRETHAYVGLALDGDADRLGVIDENGRYMSTLEVFSLLVHHFMQRRGERGGVTCTVTMSSMVDKICAEYGEPVYRTSVGFKYVGPAMTENKSLIGGEESGGFAFRGHVPERDGVLSALFFLEALAISRKSPSEMLEDLHELTGPHVFRRHDLEFDGESGNFYKEYYRM